MKNKILCILLCVIMIGGNFGTLSVRGSEVVESSNFDEEIQQESVTDLEEYETNEIIVKHTEGNISTVEGESTELTEELTLIQVEDRQELRDTIGDLSDDPNVEYIQPNYEYELFDTEYKAQYVSNDTYSSYQWAYENTGDNGVDGNTTKKGIDINLEKAWKLFPTIPDREVVVAVIDSGVDYNHRDLVNNMWINPGEISDNSLDDDNNGYIDDVYGWDFYEDNNITCRYDSGAYDSISESFESDHGTHVAGIIAAEANNNLGVAGVAGNINVKIMSVKALGGTEGFSKENGTTSSITQAIVYAESMGATICNLSFGGGNYDRIMKSTIAKSDMLFVIAAGNGNYNKTGYNIDYLPMYPASYNCDNIISVANLSYTGELADSSNFGKKTVDIAAPGTSIISTIVNAPSVRKGSYIWYTGTSMSTPMVTGVAALLSVYHENIDAKTIKKAILESAHKLNNLSTKVASKGMLDAYGALTYNFDAPVLEITEKSISKSNYKKLVIRISDYSNDVATVRYAKGKKTAEYFEKGTKGTKVSYSNNKATMSVKSTGTYTIYVLDAQGNETVKAKKVSVLKVKSVKVSPTKKTLKVGKSFSLKTTLTPKGVYSPFTFKSSNKKVASVNSKGKITAKKKGAATITVTASNGKKATCKVTVK